MVRQRIVEDFDVRHRVERKRHNAVGQNCLGEAYLRRNKSRDNSKFEALDSHAKRRRSTAITQSTTRLCSSEKRMQTIARRARGKDSARLQNHPSQSTSSTKKRTTVRRNRRIRAIGILSILQGLTIFDFFSELGRFSVAWRKKLQTTDGGPRESGVSRSNHILIVQGHTLLQDKEAAKNL